LVKRFKKRKRHFYRGITRIGKLCPLFLSIRLDGWFVFGEREFNRQ